MSIFGSIMTKIFGGASEAAAKPAASGAPPGGPSASPPTSQVAATPSPMSGPSQVATAQAATPPAPAAPVDVEAVLTKLASQNPEHLDWRKSIVDLMKLLNLDSSLSARKELASELHYAGDTNDSAAMNVWLHKQVMLKLAENGGKVPESLKG